MSDKYRRGNARWRAVSMFRGLRPWALSGALLLVLGGCTNRVVVEGSLPTPLVYRLPANVGIHYSEDFKSFQHSEKIERQGSWSVDLGQQNLDFFRNLTKAMFASVEQVSEPVLTREQAQTMDGLLVPEIVKYEFLTPGISRLKFYSASIHYRLTLLDKNNQKVADWTVVGYGKSEAGAFGNTEALSDATLLAIRDGGARIAINMPDQPGVNAWLASLASADE